VNDVKVKKSLHSATFSLSHKLVRVIWALVYIVFFRPTPVPFFAYRGWLLRLFGAKLAKGVNVYPSVRVWLPKNLSLESGSTLGPNVNIYNQGAISIGKNVVVSQGAHLCASTHDYNNPVHPLLLAPIRIENNAWICTDAFIGPHVTIAEGCVVGARAVAVKSTESWSVYGGNPAKKVNERKRFELYEE